MFSFLEKFCLLYHVYGLVGELVTRGACYFSGQLAVKIHGLDEEFFFIFLIFAGGHTRLLSRDRPLS